MRRAVAWPLSSRVQACSRNRRWRNTPNRVSATSERSLEPMRSAWKKWRNTASAGCSIFRAVRRACTTRSRRYSVNSIVSYSFFFRHADVGDDSLSCDFTVLFGIAYLYREQAVFPRQPYIQPFPIGRVHFVQAYGEQLSQRGFDLFVDRDLEIVALDLPAVADGDSGDFRMRQRRELVHDTQDVLRLRRQRHFAAVRKTCEPGFTVEFHRILSRGDAVLALVQEQFREQAVFAVTAVAVLVEFIALEQTYQADSLRHRPQHIAPFIDLQRVYRFADAEMTGSLVDVEGELRVPGQRRAVGRLVFLSGEGLGLDGSTGCLRHVLRRLWRFSGRGWLFGSRFRCCGFGLALRPGLRRGGRQCFQLCHQWRQRRLELRQADFRSP